MTCLMDNGASFDTTGVLGGVSIVEIQEFLDLFRLFCDSCNSKGFAFINYASFEASDAAIEAMNGQYLCNRAISVSYAFKKDSKGERHGSAAERLLAAQNPLSQADRPHQLFADAPPIPVAPMGGPMGGPPPPMGMRPPPPGTYLPT